MMMMMKSVGWSLYSFLLLQNVNGGGGRCYLVAAKSDGIDLRYSDTKSQKRTHTDRWTS